MNNIWLPIISHVEGGMFGLVFGIVGVGFAIAGSLQKQP